MQSHSRARWLACLPLAWLAGAGCYYASESASDGDGGSIASSEFPCEAAKVLSTCWSCHGTPVRGGATFSLDKMSDLRAPSTVAPAQTQAARSLARLRDAGDPMPPRGYPRPSDADIAMFAAWIDSGMPSGTCSDLPDPDQPAPVVCTSGSYWTGGNDGSKDMNPGLACRACHLREEREKAYFFMGTVYPTLHEEDTCNAAIPTGTRVEILDASGAVRVTMPVRARGNFYSASTLAGITLPYTARVVSPAGSTMTMTTRQTNGDCNSCHTEQGTMSAVGRILLPTP